MLKLKIALCSLLLLAACAPKLKLISSKKDSTARTVIRPSVTNDLSFNLPRDTVTRTVYTKGGIRVKTQLVHDTIFQEIKCPPDTVVVYDTHQKDVYQKPATYKEFIKYQFGWNNFEFYFAHVLLALVGLLILYVKVIKPRFL